VKVFLLWLIVSILPPILYPAVWLILLPFRSLGSAVDAALGLIVGIVRLPSRVLFGRPAKQAAA
jgi:hypothetical protein